MLSLIYGLILIPLIPLVFLATLVMSANENVSRTRIKDILVKDKEMKDVKTLSDLKTVSLWVNRIVLNVILYSILVLLLVEVIPLDTLALIMLIALVITLLVYALVHYFVERITSAHAEWVYLRATPFINIFLVIFYPFTILSYLVYLLSNRVIKPNDDEASTEDEILDLVEDAIEEGELDEEEGQLVRNVLDFGELKVEDVFVPRVHMVSAEVNDNPEDVMEKFKKTGFSRIPVYENSIDNVIGVLNHKDFYNKVLLEKLPLADFVKPAATVTKYMPLSDLLTLLQSKKAHMAIVKDEYGGTLGLVTLENVLEELVGDIWDEHDEIVERIIKVDEHSYNIKGDAELTEIFEKTGINLDLIHEAEHNTFGGWIVEHLGRLAHTGDSFEFETYLISVKEATDKKVIMANICQVFHTEAVGEEEH